jgi:DNA-directed RNA polymerase specialized sigma subunit
MEEIVLQKHRGLVKSIVKQFNPKNETEFEELEQAGLIGLMKAIRKFDPVFGTKLMTYAYYFIVGEINEFINQERYQHIDFKCEPLCKSYECYKDYLDNLSEKEEMIVSMRLAGYTFMEIANKFRCSSTSIYDTYKSLINRIATVNE